MNKLFSVAAVTISMGTGLFATGASAFPAFGVAPGSAFQPVEQARIVCEPLGRCFRIDPYGRRIFVPRPFGFGRPGYPRFGAPEVVRPGFPAGRAFDRRDGDRGLAGPDRGVGGPGPGNAGRLHQPDQNDGRGDRSNMSGTPRRQQDGGAQQRRPQNGDNGGQMQRNGGGQQGGRQNNGGGRQRQPDENNQ